MPKLGDFIGALLSDAAQARVRADLEVLKIAEAYSAHDLLKHLPVPRFRLPDITVDVPVLVSGLDGVATEGGQLFDQPTSEELATLVGAALTESGIDLPREAKKRVLGKFLPRCKEILHPSPESLLSPAKVSDDIASAATEAVKGALRDGALDGEKLTKCGVAIKASVQALLLRKLVQSPSIQVIVTSADLKSHGNPDSIVRVRLTITEDAYELVSRDDGQGFRLTPE